LSLWSGKETLRRKSVSNFIDPERKQFEAFESLPSDEPIMMLNLLRFRDKAAHDDWREVTGAESYAANAGKALPFFTASAVKSSCEAGHKSC
jgi:hypothetical protein